MWFFSISRSNTSRPWGYVGQWDPCGSMGYGSMWPMQVMGYGDQWGPCGSCSYVGQWAPCRSRGYVGQWLNGTHVGHALMWVNAIHMGHGVMWINDSMGPMWVNRFCNISTEGWPGTLPRAAVVLMKVMVILRVTSPSSSSVYALLTEPPGEQPRAKKPSAKAGSNWNAWTAAKDIWNRNKQTKKLKFWR